MQILNFTEPAVKGAIQDGSKEGTIRKAWDWLDEGQNKKGCWHEQQECRHKVGALETLMWMQRGKNGECANCVFLDEKNRCISDAYAKLNPAEYAVEMPADSDCILYDINQLFPDKKSPVFSKVFGVGKILETPKIWMDTVKEEDNSITLVVRDSAKEPLEVITEFGTFFQRGKTSISRADGFQNPVDFKNFFLKTYPILLEEQMPFWRIGWGWQP